jgi:hypothetical protein
MTAGKVRRAITIRHDAVVMACQAQIGHVLWSVMTTIMLVEWDIDGLIICAWVCTSSMPNIIR